MYDKGKVVPLTEQHSTKVYRKRGRCKTLWKDELLKFKFQVIYPRRKGF